MRLSKSSPKTPRQNKRILSSNDSYQSESARPKTKIDCAPENRSCRPKTWIAGGAMSVLLMLTGLIVHHLQKEENREKTSPHHSLKLSSTPEPAKKTATVMARTSESPKSAPYEAPSSATKTESETILHKVQILEERLRILEKIHERAPQLWNAYHQLITASSGESNFEKELNEFKDLTSHNITRAKEMECFELYAQTGVPTFETLVKNFDDVKKEILNGSIQNLAWWQKIKLSLMGLIKIRRTGEAERTSLVPADIVQQASSHLNEKNLKHAMSLLSSLKREHTPVLDAWLVHTQARQDIMKGQEFLKNQIFPEMMLPQ